MGPGSQLAESVPTPPRRQAEVKSPLPARPTVGDAVTPTLSDQPDQLAEVAGCNPVNGKIHSGRAAVITCIQAS